MKEYKISGGGWIIDNSSIIEDSISIDNSTNNTGQLRFGVSKEKSIFKCKILYNDRIFPLELRGKTITVAVEEDGISHNLGKYVVDECSRSSYNDAIINITAYSNSAIYEYENKNIKKLERYIRYMAPYYAKYGSDYYKYLKINSNQFVYPMLNMTDIPLINMIIMHLNYHISMVRSYLLESIDIILTIMDCVMK